MNHQRVIWKADAVPGDVSKFRELLLLMAAELADDPMAGAIKLNKALFFAEFGHFRMTGNAITGVEFQRLKWGPAPRALLPVRQELIDAGDARLDKTDYLGRTQDRLTPLRAHRLDLSESELRAVRQAISLLAGKNGMESSDLSHEQPGWKLYQTGETIPYATALLGPVTERTPAIEAHGRRLAAQLGLRSA